MNHIEPDAPRRQMLVCDDNAVNRKLASMLAARVGFHVTEAHDGPRGLELLAMQQFDVVLLDISMPGMSGEEVLATYLATEPDPRPRILAYTAHAFPGEKSRLLEVGFDDLLIKPIDLATLKAACL